MNKYQIPTNNVSLTTNQLTILIKLIEYGIKELGTKKEYMLQQCELIYIKRKCSNALNELLKEDEKM